MRFSCVSSCTLQVLSFSPMHKKKRLFYRILAVVAVVAAAVVIYKTAYLLKCSGITSATNIERCTGRQIEAIGILDCNKTAISLKTALPYLKFKDGTTLVFLEEYPDCDYYKEYETFEEIEVTVKADLYQCQDLVDQCSGIGLKNVKTLEGKCPAGTQFQLKGCNKAPCCCPVGTLCD